MHTAPPRRVRRAALRSRTRLWSEATAVIATYFLFVVSSTLHPPFAVGAPFPTYALATSSSYLDQVVGGRKLLGVAPDGIKTDLTSLNSFSQLIGRQPDVVEFYQGFTEPFDSPVAAGSSGTGALPLDSWGPAGTTLSDITSGRDDAYITTYADQVKAYGHQIALAVGHEMNAPWSTWWGKGPTDAQMFVTAWRHIHDIFKQQGAGNVIWVWTVNIEAGGAISPDAYYPGNAYVDWIGVDGYFHDGLPITFDGLFGPTLADLRDHYAQPILVVETGALNTPLRPSEIQSMFDAVLASPDLIGFTWFDYDLQTTDGVDWHLDDDKPSLAVYRRYATAPRFALKAPVAADTAPFYPRSTP